MTRKKWFSSRIRLVCSIANKGPIDFWDSIYVFKASSFKDGFKRALNIGKSQEEEYLNKEGEEVHWELFEILTIDQIHGDELDGAEVYFESVKVGKGNKIRFLNGFKPALSKPVQTI